MLVASGFRVCAGGIDVFDGNFRNSAKSANLFNDLVDVGSVAWVFSQHGRDEIFNVW